MKSWLVLRDKILNDKAGKVFVNAAIGSVTAMTVALMVPITYLFVMTYIKGHSITESFNSFVLVLTSLYLIPILYNFHKVADLILLAKDEPLKKLNRLAH